MKREAFKMFLKPGFEKEYEKRHAAARYGSQSYRAEMVGLYGGYHGSESG